MPGPGVVQAHLFGGGSGIAIMTGPAAALAGLALGGQTVQPGIFADAPHKNSIRGKLLQDRGIGIAAIAEQKEGTRGTAGFGIERLAQRGNLLRRQERDTGQAAGFAVVAALCLGSFWRRLDRGGGMLKTDRHQTMSSTRQRDHGGELQHALSAHKIGVKFGAEGIAAPGDSRDTDAGFA